MRRRNFNQILAYLGVAAISVGGAFVISSAMIARGRAQENAAAAPTDPVAETAPGAPAGGQGEEGDAGNSLSDIEDFLEQFNYDSVNRRDPFQIYLEYLPSDEPPEPEINNRGVAPVQRYDLEDLKLVGIMWDIKEPKAMFMDPDKEVTVLGRDESIGNRNGYIAAIREGEVVVVESLRRRGDIIYKTRVLRIER